MALKPRVFAGLIAIFAAGAGASAHAQNTFKTGNWTGGPVFNGTTFTHCYVGVGYTSKAQLTFQVTPRLDMTLIASNPGYNLDPAGANEFWIEFEGGYKKKFRGRVTADKRDTISFAVGNDPDMRRAMAGNGIMTWTDAAGAPSRYNIGNADNALRKLLACTALFGVE